MLPSLGVSQMMLVIVTRPDFAEYAPRTNVSNLAGRLRYLAHNLTTMCKAWHVVRMCT